MSATTSVDLDLFVTLYFIYSSVKEKQNSPASQVCGESKGKYNWDSGTTHRGDWQRRDNAIMGYK